MVIVFLRPVQRLNADEETGELKLRKSEVMLEQRPKRIKVKDTNLSNQAAYVILGFITVHVTIMFFVHVLDLKTSIHL